MSMRKLRLLTAWISVCLASAALAASVHAHVTVYPKEAAAGSFEKFTVRVPSESQEAPTVEVKLEIPDGVSVSRTKPVPGWVSELEADDEGRIVSIVWKAENGGLSPSEFMEFDLLGRVADDADRLVWKAYQTYGDGSVVAWTGGEQSDTPASVTLVRSGGAGEGSAEAEFSAQTAILAALALAALLLSLVSLALAWRTRRR